MFRTVASRSIAMAGSSRFARSAATTTIRPFSSTTTGGKMVAQLKEENPYVDLVQYAHKNRTWTTHHVDYYSEALAIGIVEQGLISGDVVLSWLPAHFQESMVLQFACSKAGLILYELDPATAIDDREKAKEQLTAALTLTKANVFISQEAGSDVNYVRLAEEVIPELRFFNYEDGEPFVTPRYPDLRFCINTGFDFEDKYGWLLVKDFIVAADNLDTYVKADSLNAKTPLAGQFVMDANGVPTALGKPLTNEEVVAKGIWPTYSKVLKKEFHKVEGVGVVF